MDKPSQVLLQADFGHGQHFLAAWQAWRLTRGERLVVIAIAPQPPSREALRHALAASPLPELAQELLDAWPPLTPDLHLLDFEGGRVRLILAPGELRAWLKDLVAAVDTFDLGQQAWDAHTLKRLARLAAPGATITNASSDPAVQAGLRAAGFEAGRFAPRHAVQPPAGRLPLAPGARRAIVVGAGLAGAACARALATQGVDVQVMDAADGPARGASGNPMGLFHGSLHGADGTHARFNRAAALALANALPALTSHQPGLLRLETELDVAQMHARLLDQQIPAEYAQALDAKAVNALAGLPLGRSAWLYPGGGALNPAELVAHWLIGIDARYGLRIAAIRRDGQQWQLLDAAGAVLAEAPLLVLAAGHASSLLLAGHELPLEVERGQLSHLPLPGPRVPVAGNGYAISDGAGGLWCGATRANGDMDPTLRTADHEANAAQWAALSGHAVPATPPAGRVAWRLLAPDRLPLVGGLPDPAYAGRADQARLIPRLPGLVVCTALASRGITWSWLCGEIAAALATGAPCPVRADLLDAVDPARYVVRRHRKASPA